ncbi:hypothetical protein A2U01_0017403, partial [Trifolium medium]|nr:hypothetical protein [Trifolium medium]
MLDEATKTRDFDHYARILVDIDLFRHVFDEILVERHSVQACNWLKPSEAKVDNCDKKIITIKKEATDLQYEHMRERNKIRSMKWNANKHMRAPKFQDDNILGDIQINDSVLQQATTDDVADVTVINEDLDQEEEETDDNSSSVPNTHRAFVKQADAVAVEKPFTPVDIEVSVANFDAPARAIPDTTQKIVILPDDEFDEVVQANLQVIKQAWAVIKKGETPFTH